ncbi:hypothetical protein B0H34DRAFT_795345 [Crassisporium funariophilum]|nr:hypothetical protein B0H34DRAFT_795345 [Crassisporium funariophilum]
MATQVAKKHATTLTTSAAHLAPPSSPFSSLLRQSKFASFDPLIRQSYGTPPPPSTAATGASSAPSRNASAEHAHYIEWDNAEGQVRFVRRVEEMNVGVRLVQGTPWFEGLGGEATRSESGLDSEFCPGEGGGFLSAAKPSSSSEENSVAVNSRTEETQHLQPNISAMSPRVFARYIEKLRLLRPEFKAYLQTHEGETLPIAELAMRKADAHSHMRFLGRWTERQFHLAGEAEREVAAELAAEGASKGVPKNKAPKAAHPNTPQPIRQRPHKLGGLMYAKPTPLETYFSASPQPGIILQTNKPERYTHASEPASYIASFGGMTAKLDERMAGPGAGSGAGRSKALFDPTSEGGLLVSPSSISSSHPGSPQTSSSAIASFRLTQLDLESLPSPFNPPPTPPPLPHTPPPPRADHHPPHHRSAKRHRRQLARQPARPGEQGVQWPHARFGEVWGGYGKTNVRGGFGPGFGANAGGGAADGAVSAGEGGGAAGGWGGELGTWGAEMGGRKDAQRDILRTLQNMMPGEGKGKGSWERKPVSKNPKGLE